MAEHWIQGAIKHPGAFRAEAEKQGGMGKDGKIKESFMQKAASGKFGSTEAKRAHLAETLKNMHHKRGTEL